MKRPALYILLALAFALAGCATHHPPIVATPQGALVYACAPGEDCSSYPAPRSVGPICEGGSGLGPMTCYEGTDPSQLTPAGCFLHRVVTLGHKAMECRKH